MNIPLKIIAPGKINLYLDIVGVREDGYHLLEMVMQSITLADEVRIKKNNGGIALTCSREDIPTDETNIAWQAARLFFDQCGISEGVDISILKNIPVQAGMGGGSADAAAVLLGLNQLYETYLTRKELCQLGAKLGADVPFCLGGGTAKAFGIGEELEALSPLPDCLLVIAKPRQGISTKEAYQQYDRQGDSLPHGNLENMLTALEQQDFSGVCKNLHNTFELLQDSQDITAILTTMEEYGAKGCLMSGSGSACYALFTEKSAAKRCYRHLRNISHSVFLCRPCRHGALVL